MSRNDTDSTVAEYLADVTGRVSDLPLLQRRELLADLEAHIEAERIERGAETPGQLLEILESLGSPQEIAAAAHEEASASGAVPARTPARRPLITAPAVIVGAGILLLLAVVAVVLFTGMSSVSHTEPAPQPAGEVAPR